MYLFLDTTHKITLGLLDEKFEWVDYQYIEDAKGSSELHFLIYNLLKASGLKVQDIKATIQVAGPGSYTGMRVSEGVVQIFEWQKMQTFSFYHFEVPKLVGVKEGRWISKAFKGEFFVYNWNSSGETKELVPESDVEKLQALEGTYSGHEMEKVTLTKDLIHKHSVDLFKAIVENEITRELYYYRTLEEEFKRK